MKAVERAADQGYPEAQIVLSDLVRQGRGTSANPYRAYTLARFAELRLPDGDLKTRDSDQAKRAAREMVPGALDMQEALVRDMIAHAAKPIR